MSNEVIVYINTLFTGLALLFKLGVTAIVMAAA